MQERIRCVLSGVLGNGMRVADKGLGVPPSIAAKRSDGPMLGALADDRRRLTHPDSYGREERE